MLNCLKKHRIFCRAYDWLNRHAVMLFTILLSLWIITTTIAVSNYRRSLENQETIKASKDSIEKNTACFKKLDSLYNLKY